MRLPKSTARALLVLLDVVLVAMGAATLGYFAVLLLDD